MELERWTDVKLLDCPTVGFRVATALAMNGMRDPEAGPEFFSVYGKLQHCTGTLKCSLVLPATVGDLVFSSCPVVSLLRERLDAAGEKTEVSSG